MNIPDELSYDEIKNSWVWDYKIEDLIVCYSSTCRNWCVAHSQSIVGRDSVKHYSTRLLTVKERFTVQILRGN